MILGITLCSTSVPFNHSIGMVSSMQNISPLNYLLFYMCYLNALLLYSDLSCNSHFNIFIGDAIVIQTV